MPFKVQPALVAAVVALDVLYSAESSPCVGIRQPVPKAAHCDDAVVQLPVPVTLDQINDPLPVNAQPVPVPIVPTVALWVWIYPAGSTVGNVAVTMFDPAAFVTVVAPATVKKFAVTPLKPYPVFAVKVMVAV